jgi:hypothetical protein
MPTTIKPPMMMSDKSGIMKVERTLLMDDVSPSRCTESFWATRKNNTKNITAWRGPVFQVAAETRGKEKVL